MILGIVKAEIRQGKSPVTKSKYSVTSEDAEISKYMLVAGKKIRGPQ